MQADRASYSALILWASYPILYSAVKAPVGVTVSEYLVSTHKSRRRAGVLRTISVRSTCLPQPPKQTPKKRHRLFYQSISHAVVRRNFRCDLRSVESGLRLQNGNTPLVFNGQAQGTHSQHLLEATTSNIHLIGTALMYYRWRYPCRPPRETYMPTNTSNNRLHV